ncbi:MAG TPA: hypothetical protein VIJ99_01025 [Acidimicrobiales bacterium]
MRNVTVRLGRVVKGLGMFWWDFLVGDTPEITVMVLFLLGVVALLSDVAHVNTLACVALPVFAIAGLVLSVGRARHRSKR